MAYPGTRAIKVVLFDLDGTLVKAGGSGRKALNRAVKALHGVDDICSRFSIAGRMDKENFKLAFLKATGRKPSARELRAVQSAYLKRLPLEVRKAVREKRYEVIPGILRLVKRLARRKEILLGLGTGNVKRGAAIKLQPSGLRRYFAFGGFGTDGMSRLTMLRKAVRRAERMLSARRRGQGRTTSSRGAGRLAGSRIKPEHVYVIGDTHKDILAGKKAGYRTGAVTGGFGSLARIRRARPEISAPDFRKTRLWLRWITA